VEGAKLLTTAKEDGLHFSLSSVVIFVCVDYFSLNSYPSQHIILRSICFTTFIFEEGHLTLPLSSIYITTLITSAFNEKHAYN